MPVDAEGDADALVAAVDELRDLVSNGLPRRVEARVTSVTEIGSRVRVGLLAGQPLVAEITSESVARLGLAPGTGVVASWKATATRLVAR